MIAVAGMKRSGTSLWMQLLHAAGHPYVGDVFPRNWDETLKEANPNGFFESQLRDGINHTSNPHPETGHYLHPEETRRWLVKLFTKGLVSSDVAFLHKVLLTVRPWRDVVRSMHKMRAIESVAFGWAGLEKTPHYLPPEVEWLRDNFQAIRDIAIRRHDARVVPYEQLLRDPLETVRGVLEFVGDDAKLAGDVSAIVNPSLRRSATASAVPSVFDAETVAWLDSWVAAVEAGQWRTAEALTSLNQAWQRVAEQGLLEQLHPWTDSRISGG